MARSFASQTSDQVAVPDYAGLLQYSSASILAWFKRAAAPTSGANLTIYQELLPDVAEIFINMLATPGADNGALEVAWEGTLRASFTSTNLFDDDLWHWLLLVRRSSGTFVELYVDGVSEGSSATNPGTNATSKTIKWGGQLNSSFGGRLARCAAFARTLDINEARTFAFGRPPSGSVDFYHEMMGGSPEPDWSGNGRNGTLTATTVADHAPIGPWFGLNLGRHLVSDHLILHGERLGVARV